MHCRAMNRDMIPVECTHVQEELPEKFCVGCSWLGNVKVRRKYFLKRDGHKRSPIAAKDYKVRIPSYLRVKLKVEARRLEISVNQLILSLIKESVSSRFYYIKEG